MRSFSFFQGRCSSVGVICMSYYHYFVVWKRYLLRITSLLLVSILLIHSDHV